MAPDHQPTLFAKRHLRPPNKKRTHGGKRVGAGRPPKGDRAGARHKRRPTLKARFPVHVVLRVAKDLGSLRTRNIYGALREATITVAKRELNIEESGAFRIVHISIQRTHVHLLVEADHKYALSRGMQCFQISAAKHINRVAGRERGERRRGAVFPDRFHQEIITNCNQARRSLAYVLNNWRKHREDRMSASRGWNVDPFSTGVLFDGWRAWEGEPFRWRWRTTYQPLVVYLPKTWLLRVGWRRYGTVPFREVPSSAIAAGMRR
jgi:REP element-mobilizing transposase RayT